MKFVGMGDNVVDRYINKKIMFPGGNAVNFAVYAKKCGMESAYLGIFGHDAEGQLLQDSLRQQGVDISACSTDFNSATECCDVVLKEGDRIFVGSSWETGKEHKSLKLGEKELKYLNNFDVIHCGCYADMEDEIYRLENFHGLRTFDFSSEKKFRSDVYLEKICPYTDVALFSGEQMNSAETDIIQKKVRSYGTKYVLVTNGTNGQTLFDGEKTHKGMIKRIVPIDTMGAGDSFFTAFVVSLVTSGWIRGTIADDIVVQKAFEFAADFSAQTCLVEGSFGFPAHYE